MPVWLAWTLAVVALIALAPLAAQLGRRYGRAAKGGAIFVGLLLGLGQVLDPPTRNLTELDEHRRKDRAAPGDPPIE